MSADDRVTRSIAASIAANEKWGRQSTEQRREATEPARRGLRARFEREADPDGQLSEAERVAGGQRLMNAHMLRLSLMRRKRQGKRKAA